MSLVVIVEWIPVQVSVSVVANATAPAASFLRGDRFGAAGTAK